MNENPKSSASSAQPNQRPASTTPGARWLNVFVSPGEVFEEIIALPHAAVHWRLPVLLNCLAGIALFLVVADNWPVSQVIDGEIQGHAASRATAPSVADLPAGSGARVDFAGAQCLGMVATVIVGFAGTLWAASVLWLIGRVFLRARFSWPKALEIAGLATVILALESVVTLLLVLVTGEVSARPASSLLVGGLDPAGKAHHVLAAFNVFHVWMAWILSVGLAKLAEVTVGEAAVWVFGYWIALRIAWVALA